MKTTNNTRKVPGALVWHRTRIRMITNQKPEDQSCIILDNLHKVKRKSIRLVKIGDPITIRMDAKGLPDRIKPGLCKVTHMRENGLIGTSKDSHEYDDSHYSWFEKANSVRVKSILKNSN